ncbi:polysaccharide deacetylase family protein [Tenacibaculum sp. Bg11-29]|uniref:polysaccharide deacetylase family protein n=1 Tax=Tenacibaculum sp. Bg11-29 TaxID=2058306 RepID=UPI0012FE990A|nr:polysaccharide deacetylase family protein [Tenacibaculum sp. Bg11-29]
MKNVVLLTILLFASTIIVLAQKNDTKSYWPNDAQLVISFSMQFETGGQQEGAESPFSGNPLPKGQPDLPAESWFRYGAKEGIYRMLNLWKKHEIHVTSHVVGEAAIRYPEVAKAIVDGGHEIAAHGIAWSDQWNLSYEDELAFVKKGIDTVEVITGQRGVGYNSNWLRRSPNTLKVLQELGFLYHIDDLSRDEPFVTKVRGKNFVVMPYTLRNNDIVNIAGKNWSPDQFLAQLKFEFDQLYAEGATKRRMMSISLHDRIGGGPAIVQVVDKFIQYAKQHKRVVFMRKDEIANMIKDDPNTPVDNSEIEYNTTIVNTKLPFKLEKDWEVLGFKNPESVVLDIKNNALYVSNINGDPTEKNGNGYISKVGLDGKIIQQKWITELNAPKGLVIYNDKLYVTDIDKIVEIDIKTRRVLAFKAKDATFLNDIAVDKKGNVYASNTFGFSGIYKLQKKGKRKVELWLKDENLNMPNGLYISKDQLFVANWGKEVNPKTYETKIVGTLQKVDFKTKTIENITKPIGNLDGLSETLHGFLLSDWLAGKLLYYTNETGTTTEVLNLPKGTADIYFDKNTKSVFIPLMLNNKLVKYHFKK